MGFQILNSDGEAITIADLDREAAAFWGKEVQRAYYANPYKPKETDSEFDIAVNSHSGNWFDVIGFAIHSHGHECSGWTNIVATMIASMIGMKLIDTSTGYVDRPVKVAQFESNPKCAGLLSLSEEVEIGIYGILRWANPYIALINHWQSKGYKPLKIKDISQVC